MAIVANFDNRKMHILEEDYKKILQYIEHIQYGSVTICIQGGKITQIEKNEKIKIK